MKPMSIAYYAAGVFNTAVAPNRPLNPDRDFSTTFLTSDEGELMRADLLTPGSAAIYQSLLQAGKQTAEANEGLGGAGDEGQGPRESAGLTWRPRARPVRITSWR